MKNPKPTIILPTLNSSLFRNFFDQLQKQIYKNFIIFFDGGLPIIQLV